MTSEFPSAPMGSATNLCTPALTKLSASDTRVTVVRLDRFPTELTETAQERSVSFGGLR